MASRTANALCGDVDKIREGLKDAAKEGWNDGKVDTIKAAIATCFRIRRKTDKMRGFRDQLRAFGVDCWESGYKNRVAVASSLKFLAYDIEQEAASIEQEAASIEQEAASIEQEAASIEQEAASIEQEAASIEQEAASIEQEAAIPDVAERSASEARKYGGGDGSSGQAYRFPSEYFGNQGN